MSLAHTIRPEGLGQSLSRASRAVLRAESVAGATLVAVILLAVLAGSLSRSFGRPLVWTDELAVHLMVWLAFFGASMGIGLGNHMVMGLLPDWLSPRARHLLGQATAALVLAFLLVMLALVWRWLDPVGLIRAGSPQALARESFNFVWLDPTLTLGIRKVWFWLAVPVTTICAVIHALAALTGRPAP